MALPPIPRLPNRTWLDRRAARHRRGRHALESAAVVSAIAAVLAIASPAAAICCAVIAAFFTFVAIDAALPSED